MGYGHTTADPDNAQYYLEVEEKQIAPDGVPRNAMIINGTYPGPWIQA